MGKSKKSAITGLTVNEENFSQGLADGMTNYDAYVDKIGVGKASEKTIRERASRLANKYNIIARVEQLTREQAERSAINRDWIVDKLKEITEVGTERSQIINIKTKTKSYRDTLEIIETKTVEEEHLEKMVDASAANAALDKLIKMGGLYAAEKIETEIRAKGKFILNLRDRTDKTA